MNAQRQSVKVQTAVTCDDNLTIQDASPRQLLEQWFAQLWKVAVERLAIAALDEQFVPVTKDHRAKAVPLGLKAPCVCIGRDIVYPLGEHRQDRRRQRQRHAVLDADRRYHV